MTGPAEPPAPDRLRVEQGEFALERRPPAGRRPLRAWDAADELLLDHLSGEPAPEPGRVLVVDDAFGGLSVPLRRWCGPGIHLLSDSAVSILAIGDNLRRAGHEPSDVVVHAGPDALVAQDDGGPSRIDLVAMRIPKHLDLLEDRLHRLRNLLERGVLHAATTVVATSMTKHLHTSSLAAFGRILGPTHTSLARRKARLAFCEPDGALIPGPSPWPRTTSMDTGQQVVEYAGVHAAGRVDPGTRLLLDHLPAVPDGGLAIDLGCGSGMLGMAIARAGTAGEVCFVDDSHLAVASARASYELAHRTRSDGAADLAPARFAVADGLDDVLEGSPFPSASASTVVINPPFHRDHSLGDETAWQMFHQARRVLRPGGELRVVGNRHLAHHARLHRVFGNVDVVASTPKFVVCRSVR